MLAWVVDPWSTRYEIVQGHVPLQHQTGGNNLSVQKCRKSVASPSVPRQGT